MEHGRSEPSTATRTVAARMRALREQRGWTAERLAEEMRRAGVPWERAVVAKLETGRRATVGVDELLALAWVLGVPPVYLLMPPGEERLTIAPGVALEAHRALLWIGGEQPGPSSGETDARWTAAMLGRVRTLRQFGEYYRRVSMLDARVRRGENSDEEFVHALRQLAKLCASLNMTGLGAPPLPDQWTERMRREGWNPDTGDVPGSPFIETWNPGGPNDEDAWLRDGWETDRG